jgi:hypothetical protein
MFRQPILVRLMQPVDVYPVRNVFFAHYLS